jgi:ribosome modulation factor
MALISRLGAAFWPLQEPQRKGPIKFNRWEDPEDYPCKPSFLGYRQGKDGATAEDNPYLDYKSNTDWEYGRREAINEKKYRETHPYLYS